MARSLLTRIMIVLAIPCLLIATAHANVISNNVTVAGGQLSTPQPTGANVPDFLRIGHQEIFLNQWTNPNVQPPYIAAVFEAQSITFETRPIPSVGVIWGSTSNTNCAGQGAFPASLQTPWTAFYVYNIALSGGPVVTAVPPNEAGIPSATIYMNDGTGHCVPMSPYNGNGAGGYAFNYVGSFTTSFTDAAGLGVLTFFEHVGQQYLLYPPSTGANGSGKFPALNINGIAGNAFQWSPAGQVWGEEWGNWVNGVNYTVVYPVTASALILDVIATSTDSYPHYVSIMDNNIPMSCLQTGPNYTAAQIYLPKWPGVGTVFNQQRIIWPTTLPASTLYFNPPYNAAFGFVGNGVVEQFTAGLCDQGALTGTVTLSVTYAGYIEQAPLLDQGRANIP